MGNSGSNNRQKAWPSKTMRHVTIHNRHYSVVGTSVVHSFCAVQLLSHPADYISSVHDPLASFLHFLLFWSGAHLSSPQQQGP